MKIQIIITQKINTELIENYNNSCNNLLLYCLQVYPKQFFEILYKNNNLFNIIDSNNNGSSETKKTRDDDDVNYSKKL